LNDIAARFETGTRGEIAILKRGALIEFQNAIDNPEMSYNEFPSLYDRASRAGTAAIGGNRHGRDLCWIER
jgi:hypothetical protein